MALIDEHFLRSPWAMWELDVMLAAPSDPGHSPDTAARAVLPVLLMDVEAATAAYEQHWTPAAMERARREGLLPVTLTDLHRLLDHATVLPDQVRLMTLPRLAFGHCLPALLTVRMRHVSVR